MKMKTLIWFIFIITTTFGQDYDERSQNQWWSDYSSLDDYDDDDLDRNLNLIITKNILPGDAPFPLDERLFYRRPASSEEADFAPIVPVGPRRKSTQKIIISSTPQPLPPETARPRSTPRPSRRPIFRPSFTRPPPTHSPEDDAEDDNEETFDELETPLRGIDQPPVLSDSQNIFVTRRTEAPKINPSLNRIPETQSRRVEKTRKQEAVPRRIDESIRRTELPPRRVDDVTRRPEVPPRRLDDASRRPDAPPRRLDESTRRQELPPRQFQSSTHRPELFSRRQELPPRQFLSSTHRPEISSRRPEIQSRVPEVQRRPELQSREPEVQRRPELQTRIPEVQRRPELQSREPDVQRRPEFQSREPEVQRRPELQSREPEVQRRPELQSREPEAPQRSFAVNRPATQSLKQPGLVSPSIEIISPRPEIKKQEVASRSEENLGTQEEFVEDENPRRPLAFPNSTPSPPLRTSSQIPLFPTTFRPRLEPVNPSTQTLNLQSSLPPNSAVFIPPTQSPFSPITRQTLDPNEFFASSTVSNTRQGGRRTQVLKRRFRPSPQPIVEDEETQETFAPRTRTVPNSQPERRRFRVTNDLNNPTTVQFEATPKRKSTVRRQQKTTTLAINFSPATQYPSATSGRLSEPRRIPTTFRPSSQPSQPSPSSPRPVVKKDFRKKVPATSSPNLPPSPLPHAQPNFIRRRPVVTSTPPDVEFRSASPDIEVRGRIPVTTSIPQLFLSTQNPNLIRHTPNIDISSNTEIISPADLREVARLEHSHSKMSTRFQRDETRRRNAILTAESSGNVEFVQDIDDLYLLSKLSALGDNSVPKSTSPPPNLNSSLYSWSPSCISSDKTFCSYENDYPNDLVTQVVANHETQMSRLYDVTMNFLLSNSNVSEFNAQNKSTQFVCESQAQIIRPGWVKQASTGAWLVVVNTDKFPQSIRIESCTRQNEACLFISPYYRSSCVERVSTQRMVAINPQFPHQGPFLALFDMPCGCSCQVGTQGTQRIN